MKKLILFSLILAFLVVGFVNALQIQDPNSVDLPSLTLTGNVAQTLTSNFKIFDNLATGITNAGFSVTTTLTSGSNTIPNSAISFSPPSIASIAVGGSSTVILSVAIPETTKSGTYIGVITITSTTGGTDTLTLNVVVNSETKLDVLTYTTSSPLKISGEEGKTVSKTIDIKNIGSEDITVTNSNFDITNIDLTDEDNDIITLRFYSSTVGDSVIISPGITKTLKAEAVVADNVDIGRYSGTVNVTYGTATDSLKLEILVTPEVCESGEQGNLDLTINEPDDNDDIKPGETIDIEARVKNNDNDDNMDVVVIAFLYNINEKENVAEVESEEIEVQKDGDSEVFELTLDVPNDLDEKDTYILFVKAYDSGNEGDQCSQDSVNLDVTREAHDVVIDSVEFTPSIATCNDLISAAVTVKNVGTRDEDDVTIALKDTSLKLDQKSEKFKLKAFGKSSDDIIEYLNFKIPKDASDGDYNIELTASFNNDKDASTFFAPLKLQNCEVTSITPEEGEITFQIFSATENQKNVFSIPIQLTNNANTQKQYTIEVVNAEWAKPILPLQLQLNPKQTSTYYLYLEAKPATVAGSQSATINVKSGSNILTSETATVTVGQNATNQTITGASIIESLKSSMSNNNTVFWILGDIVLVVLAVFFIKALFFPRR